jgi:hexosaminidase
MKPVYFLLGLGASLCLFFSCTNKTTTTNDYELKGSWKLVKNFERDGRNIHQATFTLTNEGSKTLTNDWTLYWNQSPRGIIEVAPAANVTVKHINGDYYQMEPTDNFSLAPGASADITLIGDGWLIKEADGPLGVYAVFNPGADQQIQALTGFTIAPFTEPEQINRGKEDMHAIPTPEYMYKENEALSQLKPEQLYTTIPSVKSFKAGSNTLNIPQEVSIQADESLATEADLLITFLQEQFGISGTKKKDAGLIRLRIDATVESAEGYHLRINNNQIEISGAQAAGVFYGTQTLLQLIKEKDGQLNVPALDIRDAPAYDYRGIHLDVGRNFQSIETLKRMIDVLSKYKVNKMVLGMTEDEGWRLEIDGLPELTEVGSRRGHLTEENAHLFPSYGSGPFVDSPTGSGYYSRSEYKDLIKYAYDRHISIIPMVNFPGHARAAIVSMENRYDRLMAEGKEEEAERFRLIDPEDKSEYLSAQNYKDNIICVCRPSVYNFYEYIIDDIQKLYEEAEVPLYMWHSGGDEVPAGSWTASPMCDEFRKDHPEITNTRNLQAYFFDQITQMLLKKGIERIGGWEEVVMAYDDSGEWYTNTQFVDRKVYPYIWNNLSGQQDLGYKIANRGYKTILCNVTNFYFDLAYDKDPREPGLYWGGLVNTKSAFSFIPKNLFRSTIESAMGKPFDPEKDFKGMEQITAEGLNNIVGLQAQLWSETVKGRGMFESYILPKLFGFAQRSWEGQASWGDQANTIARNAALDTDWNRFANTLSQVHFPLLDKMNEGYDYHLPKPGIIVENGQLKMNSAYPGMTIRYTIDGGDPNADAQVYEGPIDYEGGTVVAKVFDTRGRSGLSSTYSADKMQDIPN